MIQVIKYELNSTFNIIMAKINKIHCGNYIQSIRHDFSSAIDDDVSSLNCSYNIKHVPVLSYYAHNDFNMKHLKHRFSPKFLECGRRYKFPSLIILNLIYFDVSSEKWYSIFAIECFYNDVLFSIKIHTDDVRYYVDSCYSETKHEHAL